MIDLENENVDSDSAAEVDQEDFNDGTYSILKSGIYMIMKDIIFDFGAPKEWDGYNNNLDTYNDLHDWYPSKNYDESGVILDLNGHTFKMSRVFYYQQPFFQSLPYLNNCNHFCLDKDQHFWCKPTSGATCVNYKWQIRINIASWYCW